MSQTTDRLSSSPRDETCLFSSSSSSSTTLSPTYKARCRPDVSDTGAIESQRCGLRLPLECCAALGAGFRAIVRRGGVIASPSVVQTETLPAPLIRLPCFGRSAAAVVPKWSGVQRALAMLDCCCRAMALVSSDDGCCCCWCWSDSGLRDTLRPRRIGHSP